MLVSGRGYLVLHLTLLLKAFEKTKNIRIDRQDGDAHPGQMPPSEADDDPAVLEAALDSPARTVSTILVQ